MRVVVAFSRLILRGQLIFLMCFPLPGQADELARTFPASSNVSPRILSNYCKDTPFRGVVILKNSNGLIGGYVLVPAIMDSPIPYLDSNGNGLALFHIFDPAEKKKEASAIIDQLRMQFPIEAPLDCTSYPK